ncbi:Mpv17_PMP22 domain-containing protein/PORR domain-containing protein/zf-RING_2 domain-containing protein [Cephalotus follicularis]|uniref:Mpv17_PMP22 domain-containing protein/PORR domain-containing protein/zf-RING_2 domain-containing protein n=1 Tax=Cephalotus follicularis TaxID=3775 RepID=A0A1Q3AZI2_CEPFO|nr:Mpv17_PMP22 domain-containing protein/PORR domain-containing protein/zf-RING_2 domain-containing protein [Cephalotus follicularis]
MEALGGGGGGGGIWWWNPLRRKTGNKRSYSQSPDSVEATGGAGHRFPLKQAITSASLVLTGDAIAQVRERLIKTESLRDNSQLVSSFFFFSIFQLNILFFFFLDHDWLRALRMSSYGFLFYGPGSYAWYNYLDHCLPQQNARNFMVKVLLNQIILGPAVIAVVFAWNNLWQGKLSQLPSKYQNDAFPTLLCGLRFWIPVSALNFWIVPLHARVAFMSTGAIFWNSFLSLTMSKYCFKHGFLPGMMLNKDQTAKFNEWQRLPYMGPYNETGGKKTTKAGIKALEKRAVAISHEFSSLTVEKMVEVEKISHFRKCFAAQPGQLVVFDNGMARELNPVTRQIIHETPPRFIGQVPDHVQVSRQQHQESRLTQDEQKKVLMKLKLETYNPRTSSIKKLTKRLCLYYSQRDQAKEVVKEREREIDEDGQRCAVCLEDFEPKESVMLTPCNHMFHEECIVPWVKSHGQCPVCRFALCERLRESVATLNNNNFADVEANNVITGELISIIRAMEEAAIWGNRAR